MTALMLLKFVAKVLLYATSGLAFGALMVFLTLFPFKGLRRHPRQPPSKPSDREATQ